MSTRLLCVTRRGVARLGSDAPASASTSQRPESMTRIPCLRRQVAVLGALVLLGACAVEVPTGPGPEPAPIIDLSIAAAPAADSASP